MSEDESTDAEEKIEQFKSILIQHGRNEIDEVRMADSDEEDDPNWIVEKVIKIAELKDDVKRKKENVIKEGECRHMLCLQ